MLQVIRSRIKSAVVSILVFLLVASFALWGLEHVGSDVVSPGTEVVTVNGEPIYPEALFEQVRRDSVQFERAFGRQLTASELYSFGIVGRANDALITQAAIRDMSKGMGVAAGDELAKRSITETESFRNAAGEFSADRFRSALRQAGFSEEGYLLALKSEITRDFMTAPALHIPETPQGVSKIFLRAASETRAASQLKISASKLPLAPLSEADILKWYQDNIQTYSSAEMRSLSVVLLSQASVSVSDADLHELYKELALETPETRDVEIGLFRDESTAQQMLDRIALADANSPLEVIAESLSPLSITRFSGLKSGDGVPDVTDAIFAATKAGGVGPIQTPFGWHVARLNKIISPGNQTFEESREEIFQIWWEENGAERLFDLGNALEDTLASGSDLETAAGDLELRLFNLSNIEVSGRLPSEVPENILSEVPNFAEFLPAVAEAAFNLEKGETSALIEVGAIGSLVVRTDAIAAPAPLPLQEVRRRVIADFEANLRAEQARVLASEISTRLNTQSALEFEASYEALAPDIGLAISYSPEISGTRDEWSAQVPPQEAALLFDLTLDAPVGTIAHDDGQAIYVLRSVSWPQLNATQREAEISNVGDQWRAAFLTAILSSVREAADVEINSAAISALFPVTNP